MNSSSAAELQLRILSDPAQLATAREAVETLCRKAGFAAQAAGEIGLCVNEALANVIRHAYRGATDRPIVVTAQCRHGRLSILIRDWGSGENPERHLAEPHDPLTPGGLGLICLRKLMDHVQFRPQRDGMLLEMEKRLETAQLR